MCVHGKTNSDTDTVYSMFVLVQCDIQTGSFFLLSIYITTVFSSTESPGAIAAQTGQPLHQQSSGTETGLGWLKSSAEVK